MYEVWLAPNRRVLAMALVPVGLLAGAGIAVLTKNPPPGVRVVVSCLLVLMLTLAVGLVLQWLKPRIAYRDGKVLFYLRARAPIGVPVEVVEAFFIGQGPAMLPGTAEQSETVNLVARLSQRAPEWAQQDVKRALGHWCEGYVTIRGTWCEPLTGDVIRRLNRRLREVSEAGETASESGQ